MKKLQIILFLLFSTNILFAQNTMADLFALKTNLVFLGVDFTQAKYIGHVGFIDPDMIKNQYMPGINQIIESEGKKFSLQNAFKLNDGMYMSKVDDMINLNREVDVASNITEEAYAISEEQVLKSVSRYTLSEKAGIGIVYIAESLCKEQKVPKQEAVFTAWVTFIDLSNMRVLYTERVKGPAGGFGFRNFWARGIFEINETIEKKLYKKWKAGVVELNYSIPTTNEVKPPSINNTEMPVSIAAQPILDPEVKTTEEKAAEPAAGVGNLSGIRLKKQILTELFEELQKKGMPAAGNSAKNSIVYVFFVGKRNVTTYVSDLIPVPMYSDSTWPSGKDTRKRFAGAAGLPVEKVAMAGFFEDSVNARKVLNDFKDKVFAYDVNSLPVQFDLNPNFAKTDNSIAKLPTGSVTPPASARTTRVINLPDLDVTIKYHPNIGLMPIIDTETSLNQQFLVYQYLKDNPVILRGRDTLVASLTDYRAYTQYALGGTMDQNVYKLKLWQKAKLLAEIVIPLPEKASLEERMGLIAGQLGRILSGNTEEFQIRKKVYTQNLVDDMPVIENEIRKSTWISSLFPDVTTHYLPPGFALPAALNHLSGRVITVPYAATYNPAVLA